MRMLRRFGLMLFLALFYGLCWLALWTISFYLDNNGQQATLLLPQSLRLALLILLTRRYWPVIVAVETALLFWLHTQQLQTEWIILASVWVSLLPAWLAHAQWHRYTLYWQRLLLLLMAISLNSLLQMALPGTLLPSPLTHTLLATLTGGVLLIPFLYLLYEYLKQQHLQNLLAQNVSNPPLRTSLLVWCSLFFSLAIGVQLSLSPDVERLLLIVVFLPNVIMAYAFGWQGGVLAAVLGSLLITITRQMSGAFHDIIELELFLSTQALLGIGLGIAISRQQQLSLRLEGYRHKLEQELNRRRLLMQRLVTTEEAIRKEIARELHDDVGQNITAIQIQAQLIARQPESTLATTAAAQITQLSQRVHRTTRQLLRQLHPPVLDEMSLEKALHHLADEFAFAQRGIDFRLDYRLTQLPDNDTVILTLYRIVQELLNNISKHANARRVRVRLSPTTGMLMLEVKDDGVGIPEQVHEGFGLRGIEERVHALGGEWVLQRRNGTRIIVKLPTNLA